MSVLVVFVLGWTEARAAG